ncbi:hypothetical protein [Thermoanaerobacterium thermosaccharolyticum]|uniref:hypothetical protein n=1 Tax=Thermoanaerobacterium thermosaccharolyticum TaxID=1517 RepID=UPI003D2666C6
MTELTKEVINSMEELINRVQSVISSRVVAENNQIAEIHVLADTSRNAKQIARDVQSVLMAEFKVDVNYKIISVAQIETNGRLFNDERIAFTNLTFANNGVSLEATVMLTKGLEIYEGVYKGVNTERNRNRIIVNATLECVSKILPEDHNLILEDVDIYSFAKKRIAVVAVTHATPQNEELLVGSSIVKKDDGEALVKAALDALNRRVISILDN